MSINEIQQYAFHQTEGIEQHIRNMHINSSEYQIAYPVSTMDGRMKEVLKKNRLRLILEIKPIIFFWNFWLNGKHPMFYFWEEYVRTCPKGRQAESKGSP